MSPQAIEEFNINTWPGIRTYLHQGMVIRWAADYTKRANSATPLYVNSAGSESDFSAEIEWVERFYRERGQRPIFRLLSFAQPKKLDIILAGRGYNKADETVVMIAPLKRTLLPEVSPTSAVQPRLIEDSPGIERWLDHYHRLDEKRPDGSDTHLAILNNIPGKLAPFLLERVESGKPVAAGLGALVGPTLGIYDIVTAKHERRKGYGLQLMAHLLRWGEAAGAEHATLAVIAANRPARALYTRLRFKESHTYWYRIGAAEQRSEVGKD